MKIGENIKEYRIKSGFSQEQLAELLYVTRQTVSNWENDKNYPDINSIVLMSTIFNTTVDNLINDDIDKINEIINHDDVVKFNKFSKIFSLLFLIVIITPIPLIHFYNWIGLIFWIVLVIFTLYICFIVENIKKNNNIYTFKEINAFLNGRKLNIITKAREEGKRIYQQIMLCILFAIISALITYMMFKLF